MDLTFEGSVRDRHRQARDRALSDFEPGMWIDGWTESTDDGGGISTHDPVIDEPIATLPAGDAGTVDRAVDAAWDAFQGGWRGTDPTERAALLREWIDRLNHHLDELTLLECLDTGKPVGDARGEVEGAIATLDYFASLCRIQEGRKVRTADDLHLYTRPEPYGVVGQIVPWNFPMWAAAWKLGPALAAGNACVLKPSSDSPLTAIRLAQLSADIFPDGVLNVVTGSGSEVGGALAEHEEVRKLSFTGSTAVGQGVMRAAAGHFAPVTLELGGKSPFIVFPDADLDKVVEAVADGIFYATGQICDAFSRALVHSSVYDEFVDRFVDRADSYVVGDPLDPATTMGPLTSQSQFDQVMEYIEIGREEGASLLTGGGIPDLDALADGWFVEPTVFGAVDNDMRIAQEEIFGPVQTINTFDTYDEAIALANDTQYGLAAGIGTEDSSTVHRAAADIDAGLVYVNEYGPILPDAPYGGFKASGFGKDLGKAALDHYRRTKTVYVNLDDPSW